MKLMDLLLKENLLLGLTVLGLRILLSQGIPVLCCIQSVIYIVTFLLLFHSLFYIFRAFTEALGLDDENAWTRKLIDEYGENMKKGVEGDIPAPGISIMQYCAVQ